MTNIAIDQYGKKQRSRAKALDLTNAVAIHTPASSYRFGVQGYDSEGRRVVVRFNADIAEQIAKMWNKWEVQ